jgi:hypothetical protein
LHGVQRGALAQIVGNDPDVQAVFDRRVLADAADIYRVLAGAFLWRDIALVMAVVDNLEVQEPEALEAAYAARRDPLMSQLEAQPEN